MTAAAGTVARFDAASDRFFDRLRGRPKLDRIMYAASELGDHSLIWLIAATTTAALGDEAAERRALRLAVGLGIESALVNGPIKAMFGRERPTSSPEERAHRLRTPRTSSFPSGHASAAACAVVLTAGRQRPWTTTAMVLVATVVAASRIHVRIHHGSDVVGGVVVGAAIGRSIRRKWPLR
ncbi:MAG: phosphatase PAP2 family protein [Microthrixaceae bacterium]|nr:phosphatase PAP2 family protein [Microthrixaceae bacterium]